MIGTKVQLSQEEKRTCIQIGKERNSENVKNRSKNMRYSKDSDEIISIRGVMGEFAFNKIFNLSQDDIHNTECRNVTTDEKQDAQLLGKKIDVKCTYITGAPIRVMSHKKKYTADMYALIIIQRKNPHADFDENEIIELEFKGFIHPDVLFRPLNVCMIGCKKYYIAPQSDLSEWDEAITGKY